MKFKNPLLVVTDINNSIMFYTKVLGLHVTMDFGTNVTLTGGVCLQTQESWLDFTQLTANDLSFNHHSCEIYFEEDNFDQFIAKLEKIPGISYIHPVVEHTWGQRAVRFYDPDKHIIEVGENIKTVCKRFINSGMTVEEVAQRMDVPLKFVNSCIR